MPLYLHGVPSNSDDWLAFLERTGGLALDLPGFGRSGKPGSLRYTIEEYDGFLERFLEQAGVERVSLVMHDWGAVGLAFAQRQPERVERLVIINAVPLPARLPLAPHRRASGAPRCSASWRWGPPAGVTLRLASKESNATPGPMPEAWLDSVLDALRPGHPAGDPAPVPQLAARRAGGGRRAAGTACECPRWSCGACATPTSPAASGSEYARRAAGHAELLELPDAGHGRGSTART